MIKFRIVREGGLFFIEKLAGKRWVPFPMHRHDNKFASPEAAKRWLVDHENWRLVQMREMVEEIEIDPEDVNKDNEPCLSITSIGQKGVHRIEMPR